MKEEKYKKALNEVLVNLRATQAPYSGDPYIDESIKIIMIALRED